MNANCRRFLAVNCALNGHDFLEAFDGDVAAASRVLDRSEKYVTDLQQKYAVANVKPKLKDLYDVNIITILNFLRCSEYAFVAFPNTAPITLKDFVETDRRGEITAHVREVFLQGLLRDVAVGLDSKAVRIADGVVHTTLRSSDELMVAIKGAYLIYKSGPKTKEGFNESVLQSRHRLTLASYRDMPASTCRELLEDILQQNLNPTVYRDSLLFIPDLLPVYQATGTVIGLTSEVATDNVYWLLDIVGTEKAKTVCVPLNTIRSLINNSARDLSNIAFDPSKGSTGLVVV